MNYLQNMILIMKVFFHSNIRDEKGYPILLQSKEDIHNFLLDYINNYK